MTKAAYPTIGIAAFVMFVIVYFIGCLHKTHCGNIFGKQANNNCKNNIVIINPSQIDDISYTDQYHEKKPAIEVEFINDGQVALLRIISNSRYVNIRKV